MELAEIVPWWRDRPDFRYSELGARLVNLWVLDPELGRSVAMREWISDGVVYEDQNILGNLVVIAQRDLKLAQEIAEFSWLQGQVSERDSRKTGHLERISSYSLEAARSLTQLEWMGRRFEKDSIQLTALRKYFSYLRDYPELAHSLFYSTWFYLGPDYLGEHHFSVAVNKLSTYPEGAGFLGSIPWLTDVIKNDISREALDALGSIARVDPLLSDYLATSGWVIDGVSYRESLVLILISEKAETDLETARAMAQSVESGPTEADLDRLEKQ